MTILAEYNVRRGNGVLKLLSPSILHDPQFLIDVREFTDLLVALWPEHHLVDMQDTHLAFARNVAYPIYQSFQSLKSGFKSEDFERLDLEPLYQAIDRCDPVMAVSVIRRMRAQCLKWVSESEGFDVAMKAAQERG